MREIQATYTLTEAEFRETWGRQRHPVLRVESGAILLYFILLLLLLYGTPALWDWYFPPPSPPTLPRRLVLGIAPWIYVLAFIFLVKHSTRMATLPLIWKNAVGLRLPHTVVFTDRDMTIETACSRAVYQWALVTGIRESPGFFSFFFSASTVYTFPKRALPPEIDLDEFRREISRRINVLALSPEEFVAQSVNADASGILPQLQFSLKLSEFMHIQKYDRFRWAPFRLDSGFFFLLYFIAAWIFLGAPRSTGAFTRYLRFLLATSVIILIQNAAKLRQWRKQPGLYGPQTVDIAASGLRFSNERESGWFGWGSIERFRRKDKLFLLTLRDGSSRCIPERAFPDPQSLATFENLLRSKILASTGFPVIAAPAQSTVEAPDPRAAVQSQHGS